MSFGLEMTNICESCELRTVGVCAVLIGTPPDQKAVENRKGGVVRARRFLQRNGDRKGSIKIIRKGWAASVEITPDGRHLTSEILVPGDAMGAAFMMESVYMRNIRAMTDVEYCSFEAGFVLPLLRARPDMLEVLLEVMGEIIRGLRGRLVDLGRRDAEERVASFIVSLHDKLERRGLLRGPLMPFPLRQKDIADALGLTTVHTNRVLRSLREAGVLTIEKKEVQIADVKKIRAMVS